MQTHTRLVQRFHRILVDEIRQQNPRYLTTSFTVAEIYQALIPYRTHRDRLGVEINGDYEDTLLRLLAGEGEYLLLESDPARLRIRRELEESNPNTGIYREFAAVSVRLNPEALPDSEGPPAESATAMSAKADEPSALQASTTDATRDDAGRAPAAPPQPSGPSSSKENGPDAGRGTDAALPSACPECSEPLPARDSLRFCPTCGANVLTTPCSACGELLERSWRYCVACGVPAGT